MTKIADTILQHQQEELARLIITTGNALRIFVGYEDSSILPMIRAIDKPAFLQKHTQDYKKRLHSLLQTIFWSIPAESTFWPAEKQARAGTENLIENVRNLMEFVSNDLSQISGE